MNQPPLFANQPLAVCQLSLVVPMYNYAQGALGSLEEIERFFSTSDLDWQVVVVDDGSTDGTYDVLLEACARMPRLVLVRLEENQGKGGAVLAGLRLATGRVRVFMDCDLAYPPSQAYKLYQALGQNGSSVAVANRRLPGSVFEISMPLLKRAYSRHRYGLVFNWVVRQLLGLRYTDTQAGLKGFRAEVIPLLDSLRLRRFAFDVELMHVLAREGVKVVEVPVHYRCEQEESTVHLFTDGFKMLGELLQVKLNTWRGLYGRVNGRHPHSPDTAKLMR